MPQRTLATITLLIIIVFLRPATTIDLPPTWSRVGVTVVDTAQASGTHVEAPVYIAANLTWQVSMQLLPAPNAVLIPLIQDMSAETDRNSATFPTTECTGYVTVCCLRRLERHFVNAELSAYTDFLQLASYDKYDDCAKAPVPTEQTVRTLADIPSTRTFTRNIFPSALLAGATERPRVWVSDIRAGIYTIEFPDEILDSPWLTSASIELDPIVASQVHENSGTDMSDVINRLMTIRIALIHRTQTSKILLTLSEHNLLFRAATRDLDKPAKLIHVARFAPCTNRYKPPNALWRADIQHSAANISGTFVDLAAKPWWDTASMNLSKCLWFCRPGFYLYPSVTDFYHAIVVPETVENTKCLPMPHFGAEIELNMHAFLRVDIDDSVLDHTAETCAQHITGSTTNTREIALAFTLLAIQEGIPPVCGLDPSASAWLLRGSSIMPLNTSALDTTNATVNSTIITPPLNTNVLETVTMSMDVSIALFTNDLESSARAQQGGALECMTESPNIQTANNQIARSTQIQLSVNSRSQCAGITLSALKVQFWFTVTAKQTRMRYPPKADDTSLTVYFVMGTWALMFLLFICYGCSVMYTRAHRGPVGLWRAHRMDRGVLDT